jgi:hypothetical protein
MVAPSVSGCGLDYAGGIAEIWASHKSSPSAQARNIDEISGKYLGRPYPNFSGRPETRMIITVEADSVRGMGAR